MGWNPFEIYVDLFPSEICYIQSSNSSPKIYLGQNGNSVNICWLNELDYKSDFKKLFSIFLRISVHP